MKLTLTIGIPAHNEESGIARLLDSIIMQDKTKFKLEKVIVLCDGCTDNTAKIVRKYGRNCKYIEVIDDGLRTGKSGRLNQLYRLNRSDIIATFDADTKLAHKNVLNELIKPFSDKKVGLVGGSDVPAKPSNWIQKMAVTWVNFWNKSKDGYKNNISVNNHKGVVSALRKELAKKIIVPKNIVGDDDFVYFKAVTSGWEFRYAKKAIVNYFVPSKIKEYFVQITRFYSAKHKLAVYFGDWIYPEYEVPTSRKIKALIESLIEEPFYMPLAIIFQILQRIFEYKFEDNYKKGYWITVASSK
jgi:cellulose synthase/poly-beta-1,6-N-acetylglucosamine synthase-like glycosyltransferase